NPAGRWRFSGERQDIARHGGGQLRQLAHARGSAPADARADRRAARRPGPAHARRACGAAGPVIELGVNIDHVATVRQARLTYEPDPVWAAVEAHLGGADGITVHLRNRSTSLSLMWRRSSRRCTVMPSAPPRTRMSNGCAN